MCYYSMAENKSPIMVNQQEQENDGLSKKAANIKIGDELIVQVTKEDVNRVANLYSSPESFSYVAVSPKERVF